MLVEAWFIEKCPQCVQELFLTTHACLYMMIDHIVDKFIFSCFVTRTVDK